MKLLAILAAAALASSCAGTPPTTAPSPDQPPQEGQDGEDSGQFVVSREVYTRTFEEIGEFIDKLNLIIRNADYESWLTFLSEEYIRVTADPLYLKDQSEKPLLKQANIQLADLRDYFAYVVVPSRTQATVDEIEFLDENRVKALAVLRGTRVILYLLERHDNQWKIGVW